MNEMQPVDNSADGVTALLILNKHFMQEFNVFNCKLYIARLFVSPEVKRTFVWEYERQLRAGEVAKGRLICC